MKFGSLMKMMILALVMLASITKAALVEFPHMFTEPTDVSDQIKITDIDGIPGTFNVLATGVWEDVSNAKFVMFVMSIEGQGVNYVIKYAFSMTGSNAITSMPAPQIAYVGSNYLVSFKDPDSDKIFMFEQAEGATSITSTTMLLVNLPAAYTGLDYKVGFVSGTAAIMHRPENPNTSEVWWISAINTSSGAKRWSFTYSDVASCAIRGYDTYFVVMTYESGANHEVSYIDATSGTVNFSAQFSAEGTYTQFGNIPPQYVYGLVSASNTYRFGFASNSDTTNKQSVYNQVYLELDSSGNIIDEAAHVYRFWKEDADPDGDGTENEYTFQIEKMKVQFEDVAGSKVYFFFQSDIKTQSWNDTSDDPWPSQVNFLQVFYDDDDGSKRRYSEQSGFPIFVDNTIDTIEMNGITMMVEDEGFIFGGMLTRYQDTAGSVFTRTAPSAFYGGIDYNNTCVNSRDYRLKLDQAVYTSTTTTTPALTTSTIPLVADTTAFSSDGSIQSITDYSVETFADAGEYNYVEGECSQPSVFVPSITTQYYVINSHASTSQDIDFDPDIYWGPTWYVDTNYSTNTWYESSVTISQTESSSASDPSWATLSTVDKTTISTTSTADKGTYTLTVRGDLFTSSGASTTIYNEVSFTVYLVELVSQALNAMEVSVGKGVSNQAITGWTFDPIAENIASYTITYTLEERSGGTVPSWVTINGSNEIEVDDASIDPATELAIYQLQVKGTAVDESGNTLTDRYAIQEFDLTVYTLEATTTTSQYHAISQGSDTYTFSAFTGYSHSTYTPTYSLYLAADGTTDAVALYSWLSLTGNSITINSSTASDAGQYDLLISGQLDDSAQYPGAQTTASVAVTIWLYSVATAADGGSAQEEMFYIIGDTTISTDAINVFSITPALDVTYTFTYSVAFSSGPGAAVSSFTVVGQTDIQVGVESSTALAGAWTASLQGQLDDPDSTTISEDFTLNLIKLEGTVSDQTYRIQSGTTKTVTFSAVTHSPTGGNIPTYTYTYTLIGYASSVESVADAGIFNIGTGTTTFDIATSDASAALDYALAIKAVVAESTTAEHYMPFTAKLFTYTAQANDYQVYIYGSGSQTYTILAPVLVSGTTFTPTCVLYDSDGTTDATVSQSSWLSFNSATEVITVNAGSTGLAAQYDLRYICTLDDDESSVEETAITYYLIEAAATAQDDIMYVLSQDESTVAISAFTYSTTTVPLTGSVSWAYSVAYTSGDANICTVSSSTGTDILIGQTSGATAGATTGTLTSDSLAGTHVYTLSGTLSFTDSLGRAWSVPAVTTTVTIEIIKIEISVAMVDMYHRSGTTAEVQTFSSFVQSSSGGSIPNYTYTYTLVEWDGSDQGATTASQLSIDSSAQTVTVYEADATFVGATYPLAVKATVDQVPSAVAYASFVAEIYSFQATEQTNPEYLVGTNPMVHTLAAFVMAASGDDSTATETITYSLELPDGSDASSAYAWLSVDLTTPALTISTADESEAGIYELVLLGSYGTSTFQVSTTFYVHIVKMATPGTVSNLFYRVGAHESQLSASPFDLEYEGSNHRIVYSLEVIDESTGTASSTIPDAIRYLTGAFSVTAYTDDDSQVGKYLMRMTATASDSTGADINTRTETLEFYVVVMQIYTYALEDQQEVITETSYLYEFPKFTQLPAADDIVPSVAIDYSLRIESHDNEIADPKVWDFADIYSNSKLGIYTDDLDLSANYTTALIGYYTIAMELDSNTTFNIELLLPARSWEPGPPDHDYFRLFDHSMDISEGWELALGEIRGKYGDVMTLEFSINKPRLRDFATFDNDNKTNAFAIEEGSLNETHVGRYKISAIARFANGTYTEHYTDSFWLTVRNDNPVVIDPEQEESDIIDLIDLVIQNNKTEVQEDYLDFWQDNNYPQITQVVEGLELEAHVDGEQPIPYIRDLTTTGLLLIEWDRPMFVPDEPQQINRSRVAVENKNTTDESLLERRRLYYRYYDIFDNFELDPEWYLIIEALELKLRPGDPETERVDLNFTWYVVSFDSRQIYIQIDFDHPERISHRDRYDVLEVYFWGTDFFKSEDGLTVRFGSKLERKILRQIRQEAANWLWWIGQGIVWLIWAICLFTILLSGRILATWMFLNSLQLVTHLVLFKSQMPAMTAYSFTQLLYVARFNPFPHWNGMIHEFGHVLEGGHNERFVGFGYESIYLLSNLNIIVLLAALVLFMWALLWLKDFFAARCSKRLNLKERIWYDDFEGRWHNLAHRFTYEIFLELLICGMISLAVRNPYTDDNFSTEDMKQARYDGIGGNYETNDDIFSALITVVAICFFIWAVSFAWRQIATWLCCTKTRYKPVTSALWCCKDKEECITKLKECPKKCLKVFLDCVLCRCKRKKKRRSRKKTALKYAIKDGLSDATERNRLTDGTFMDDSGKQMSANDQSKTMILAQIDELSSDSSDDYVSRKVKQKTMQKRIAAGEHISSSSSEEKEMSGADMMKLQSAWIGGETWEMDMNVDPVKKTIVKKTKITRKVVTSGEAPGEDESARVEESPREDPTVLPVDVNPEPFQIEQQQTESQRENTVFSQAYTYNMVKPVMDRKASIMSSHNSFESFKNDAVRRSQNSGKSKIISVYGSVQQNSGDYTPVQSQSSQQVVIQKEMETTRIQMPRRNIPKPHLVSVYGATKQSPSKQQPEEEQKTTVTKQLIIDAPEYAEESYYHEQRAPMIIVSRSPRMKETEQESMPQRKVTKYTKSPRQNKEQYQVVTTRQKKSKRKSPSPRHLEVIVHQPDEDSPKNERLQKIMVENVSRRKSEMVHVLHAPKVLEQKVVNSPKRNKTSFIIVDQVDEDVSEKPAKHAVQVIQEESKSIRSSSEKSSSDSNDSDRTYHMQQDPQETQKQRAVAQIELSDDDSLNSQRIVTIKQQAPDKSQSSQNSKSQKMQDNDLLFASHDKDDSNQQVRQIIITQTPKKSPQQPKKSPQAALRYEPVSTVHEMIVIPQLDAPSGMGQTMAVFSKNQLDDAGSADFVSAADRSVTSSHKHSRPASNHSPAKNSNSKTQNIVLEVKQQSPRKQTNMHATQMVVTQKTKAKKGKKNRRKKKNKADPEMPSISDILDINNRTVIDQEQQPEQPALIVELKKEESVDFERQGTVNFNIKPNIKEMSATIGSEEAEPWVPPKIMTHVESKIEIVPEDNQSDEYDNESVDLSQESDDNENAVQNPMMAAGPPAKNKNQPDRQATNQNNVFQKMKTKKAFMYEGGEAEEDFASNVIYEGGEQEDTIGMPKTIDKVEQPDDETMQEEKERQERARKNVEKEYQIMNEAKQTWPRSRTLFYGLRFDWKTQILTMHISLFLVRRVILAAFLVFGGKFAYWGLQIMIATCILMLWILVSYEQWRFEVIQIQHIINELTLYVLCWMLLIFQGAFPQVDDIVYAMLGWYMLAFLVLFVFFNLLVIFYDGIYLQFKRHCMRRDNIVNFRINHRHKLKDLNRRNQWAWKQLQEWHRKRRLMAQGKWVEVTEKIEFDKDGISAAEQVNLLINQSNMMIHDIEQPPKAADPQAADNSKQIVIEDQQFTKSNDLSPSRNKIVNITTSVRSSVVKNNNPSIMSDQEQTPRKPKPEINVQNPVQKTTVTTYVHAQEPNRTQSSFGTDAPSVDKYVPITLNNVLPQPQQNIEYLPLEQGSVSRRTSIQYVMPQQTLVNPGSYAVHQNTVMPERVSSSKRQNRGRDQSERDILKLFIRPGSARAMEARETHDLIKVDGLYSPKYDDDRKSARSDFRGDPGVGTSSEKPQSGSQKEREPVNMTTTSYAPVGINFDKWKMPMSQAIKEVSSENISSRAGTAQKKVSGHAQRVIDNANNSIHNKIDDILFAKKKTLVGINKQPTISKIMDLWGSGGSKPTSNFTIEYKKKPEPRKTVAVTNLPSSLNQSDYQVTLSPKKSSFNTGVPAYEPITLKTSNLGTSNIDLNRHSSIQPQGGEVTYTVTTSKQPMNKTTQEFVTQDILSGANKTAVVSNLASTLTGAPANASRTNNMLMKKDTITTMLEEVDSSIKFRATHALQKVRQDNDRQEDNRVGKTTKVEIPLNFEPGESLIQRLDVQQDAAPAQRTDVSNLGSSRKLSSQFVLQANSSATAHFFTDKSKQNKDAR